jgi:hypothetical protein
MNILNFFLYFISGILMNMSLNHLLNFSETTRHPIIAKTKFPKLTSTLWGLAYLFLGAVILLALHYKFELQPGSAFIFLGFSAWAIFLAVISERADRRKNAAKN